MVASRTAELADQAAGRDRSSASTPTKDRGPPTIGNYLAGLGIPATAGFGVTYTGLHATDERFRVDTVPTVQTIYHAALLRLLTP